MAYGNEDDHDYHRTLADLPQPLKAKLLSSGAKWTKEDFEINESALQASIVEMGLDLARGLDRTIFYFQGSSNDWQGLRHSVMYIDGDEVHIHDDDEKPEERIGLYTWDQERLTYQPVEPPVLGLDHFVDAEQKNSDEPDWITLTYNPGGDEPIEPWPVYKPKEEPFQGYTWTDDHTQPLLQNNQVLRFGGNGGESLPSNEAVPTTDNQHPHLTPARVRELIDAFQVGKISLETFMQKLDPTMQITGLPPVTPAASAKKAEESKTELDKKTTFTTEEGKKFEDARLAEIQNWTESYKATIYQVLHAQGMTVEKARQIRQKAKLTG